MRLDEAIRRRGFRRWYERQLYEGHAYLVTGFLALIMMMVAIEVLDRDNGLRAWTALAVIAGVGGALCVFAWRQFTKLVFRAEYVAERATCPACRTYARLEIDGAEDAPEAVPGCLLRVHCRACGHPWKIE